MKNKEKKQAPLSEANSVSGAPAQVPKPKKKKGKIFLIVIILLILLFGVLTLGGITLFWLGPTILPPSLFARFEQIIGENISDKLDGGEEETLTVQSDSSQVVLTAESYDSDELSIKAVAKENWPEGALGGFYEIETDKEEFSGLPSLKIELDNYPGGGFVLGYYDETTKTWEYIPTISRSLKVYEGFLLHASAIGGYQTTPEEMTSQLTGEAAGNSGYRNDLDLNAEQQQDLKNLSEKSAKALTKQGQGETVSDEEWQEIAKILERLSKQAIEQCKNSKTPANQRLFYYIWSIAQMLGFDELSAKFAAAENECRPKKKEDTVTNYIIKETDQIKNDKLFPGSISLNTFNTIVSDGQAMPSIEMATNPYRWQTDWEVWQDFTSSIDAKIQLKSNGFWSSPINSSGQAVGRSVALFSLANVKEGETFPVEFVSIGNISSYLYGPKQKFIVYSAEGNPQYIGLVDPSTYSEGKASGASATTEGILVQDLGSLGAVIDIGGTLTGEAAAAIEAVENLAAGTPFQGYATTAITNPATRLHIRVDSSAEPVDD